MERHSRSPTRPDALKPLGAYSRGILWSKRVRRLLELSGWRLVDARFAKNLAAICGWAYRPSAERPRARAARDSLPYIALEDGFLRSLDLGLRGEPPTSLLIDAVGVHYAADAPSRLEQRIADAGPLSPETRARAAAGVALLRQERLSKYNMAPDVASEPLAPGYVLVVDQTWGDASIVHGGAGPETFLEMLTAARDENPGADVVVKTHPDVAAGLKRGHFSPTDLKGARFYAADVSPWTLIESAAAVYVATSQMGFEALMAGKRVVVFGAPFYAGWGATEDRGPRALYADRRQARRSVVELFAAAYLDYPVYYDPFADQLGDFEAVARQLSVRRRVEMENRRRAHCVGVTLWKRGVATAFLGARGKPPAFHASAEKAARAAAADGGRVVAWSSRAPEAIDAARTAGAPCVRMEDGFLRSVGLGQALRIPASLAIDGTGVYYDPRGPSDLERLIAAVEPDGATVARAARLRERIVQGAVTKYMLDAATPPLPARPPGLPAVLVVGQVEGDASILCGATDIRRNAALLAAARAARPDAYLVYKPHPDVEAGYRLGAVGEAARLADHIASSAPAPALLAAANEVWTMTSLMGFEALLRGKRVVCCGWPFYAGWGLTEDRGAPPTPIEGVAPLAERRAHRPSLDAVVAAAYLRYPRYVDPITGLPCDAETILDRLIARDPRLGRHPNPLIRGFGALRDGFFALRRGRI